MGIRDIDFIGGNDAVHLVRFLFEMTAIEEALGTMIVAYFAPQHEDRFEEEFVRSMPVARRYRVVRKIAKAGEYGERSERLMQILDNWNKDLREVRNAVAHKVPTISVVFADNEGNPDPYDIDIEHTFVVKHENSPDTSHTFADLGTFANQAFLIRMLLTPE